MGRWLTGLLLALSIACAQPPAPELAMAAARLEQARAAGAELYADQRFEDARAALERAREAMTNERNYRAALESAAYASLRAHEARTEAREAKRKWVRELDRLVRENEALLEEARSRGAARRGPLALGALQKRYDAIRKAYAEERLFEALDRGQALKADLLSFLHTLDEWTVPTKYDP